MHQLARTKPLHSCSAIAASILMISTRITIFLSIGFILAGFYIYLLQNYPVYHAMIMFGILLIGLSIIFMTVLFIIQHLRNKKLRRVRQDIEDVALQIYYHIETEFNCKDFFKENPTSFLLAAAFFGLVAGKKLQ